MAAAVRPYLRPAAMALGVPAAQPTEQHEGHRRTGGGASLPWPRPRPRLACLGGLRPGMLCASRRATVAGAVAWRTNSRGAHAYVSFITHSRGSCTTWHHYHMAARPSYGRLTNLHAETLTFAV